MFFCIYRKYLKTKILKKNLTERRWQPPLPGKRNRMYDSFLGKSLVNSQKTKLIRKYDFSPESWLAKRIIKLFNEKMDAWEKQYNIQRLRPGQLLTSFENQKVVLPLLKPDWIKSLTQGITWSQIRPQIESEILLILQQINSEVTITDVRHLVNQRSLLPKTDGFRWHNFKTPEQLGDPEIHKKHQKKFEEESEIPLIVAQELTDFLTEAEKLSRQKARSILETLNGERIRFCPLKSDLKIGQIVWIGMDSSKFSPFKITTDQRYQVPLVITLYTLEEIVEARNINDLKHLNEFNLKRIERVCFEAYHQGAVLGTSDLNLMFFINRQTISTLCRKYIELTEVILPTPGTKKDCGRAMSHKKIIIDKHLQGMLNKQIKSATNHDEESIDRYLNAFQSVLILYLYEVPQNLMSKVLNTGSSVVKEYITIIESYFEDREKMLGYLKKQGVKLP